MCLLFVECTGLFSKHYAPVQQIRCPAKELLAAATQLGQTLAGQRRWGGGVGWVSDWDPSLEGFVCHLTLLAFVCVNSKMRLPLSLSAPFQKGLKNVFDEAILAALEPPEPKKTRRCVLL